LIKQDFALIYNTDKRTLPWTRDKSERLQAIEQAGVLPLLIPANRMVLTIGNFKRKVTITLLMVYAKCSHFVEWMERIRKTQLVDVNTINAD
jgi:hypothetical protein